MPDVRHGPTLLHGCLVRFCADPPRPSGEMLRKLRRFVRQYVKRYTPLESTADVSVETWLENTTTYSAARKAELLKQWNDSGRTMDPRTHTRLSSFGKVETYMKFKAARGINSRSDVFKCFSGPYFKLMESEVYKDPAFIKHTPVRLRPQYIMEMMGANPGPYYETDYSQFEKHFTRPVMLSLEMILYAHLLRNHPGALREIRRAMLGTNRCTFRHFQIKISARRMSGEMCTSLSMVSRI